MKNRFIKLSFLSAAILTLSAGATMAGFEYVPAAGAPSGTAPHAAPDATLTPAPAAQVPLEPVTSEPVLHAPVVTPAVTPPPLQATPQPAPQPNLLKVRTVTPTPQPAPGPALQPLAEPASQQASQPAPQPAPQTTAAIAKQAPPTRIIWNPAPAANDGVPVQAGAIEQTPPAAAPIAAPAPVDSGAPQGPVTLTPQMTKDMSAEEMNRAYGVQIVKPHAAQQTQPVITNSAPEQAPAPAAENRRRQPLEIPPGLRDEADGAPVTTAPAASIPALIEEEEKLSADAAEKDAPADAKVEASIEKINAPLSAPPALREASKDTAPKKAAATTEDISEKASPAARKIVINPFPQGEVAPAPAADTAAAPAGDYETVVGFGADMPLALAVQQIAPPSYAFSFGTNVDPGVLISWDGAGKPWNQVINEALAPHGLKASISGSKVHITRLGDNALAPQKQSQAEPVAKQPAQKTAQADAKKSSKADVKTAAKAEEKTEEKADERVRRVNIVDPGEESRLQPLSKLVSLDEAPAAPDNFNEPAPLPLLPVDAEPAAGKADISVSYEQDGILAGIDAGAPQTASRGTWAVRQGDSLKDTLHAWSDKADVNLVWNATHDYTVDADITVNDTFSSAVNMVVNQGMKNDKPLIRLQGDKLIVEDRG